MNSSTNEISAFMYRDTKPKFLNLLLEFPYHPDQGVLIVDTINEEIHLSNNLRQILHIDDEKINLDEYLKRIDEVDLKRIKFQFIENYADQEILFDEYKINTEEGWRKNFRSFSRLVKNSEEQIFIVANISDTTRSHEINKAYQEKLAYIDMALDNSIDMFCAFDLDLSCISWNKKCEEITGFLKSEAIGKPAVSLFPLPRKEKVITGLRAALKGDVSKVLIEEFSPQNLIIEKFIIPLKDNKGRIFGVMIAGHDVTAIKATANRLKELYQAIKEKNAELERSNNELASFSYIASHDLQEPLRKIQTFSRKILDTDHAHLSEPGKDSFRRIENAAQRMQSLINDLHTFSRTTTQPKEFAETDLNILLYEVKTELREKLEAKKANIISEELPTCRVIGFQIRQLLENILNNSLKYSNPSVNPKISIKCKMLEEDELPAELQNEGINYFSITISDNGIGFEPQYSDKIFELFQRLHGKHEYPGTGLGLAICKKIVQNHNGHISAEGNPGKGTTIKIILPFQSDNYHNPFKKQKAN